MNNAQAMQRAIAVFCDRVASPGQVAWTERHDKLLTEVAQRFNVDENELFVHLMGGSYAEMEPDYLPALTSQELTEDLRIPMEWRGNGNEPSGAT